MLPSLNMSSQNRLPLTLFYMTSFANAPHVTRHFVLLLRLVLESVWDIDSKVINIEVKVNPDDITYDMEEVANCTVNLDYMESNKIK